MLGALTGVGGGILRDMLVAEIPDVLRGELYASAALAGAIVVVTAHQLSLPMSVGAIFGGILCFLLRFLAIRRGWRLPVADHPTRRASDEGSANT